MPTATLFGGFRDGTELTVMDPIPDVLQFPTLVTPSLEDWKPRGILAGPNPDAEIAAVTYRLRPAPRCCASWCTWPRRCNCCPRCYVKRLVYDLEKG